MNIFSPPAPVAQGVSPLVVGVDNPCLPNCTLVPATFVEFSLNESESMVFDDAALIIKPAGARVLNLSLLKQHNLCPLDEFGQFGRYPCQFEDVTEFESCALVDIFLADYVHNWPSPANAPPDPALFELCFQPLIRALAGGRETLFMYVHSIDPHYFEPLEVIDKLLVPEDRQFLLLGSPLDNGMSRTQRHSGHLLFEWPVKGLHTLAQEWFVSPFVSIEGYIGDEIPLPAIAQLYYAHDLRSHSIREFLKHVELAFRVWPDNNGLLVLSDKLDINTLRRRVQNEKLESEIAAARARLQGEKG